MNRKMWIGLFTVGASCLGLAWAQETRESRPRRPREETQWEYRVTTVTFNPGERLTEEKRAAAYEKLLNDMARQGWETVGTLLSRDHIQTIGGGATTRETTSFVAFRRLRR